MRLTSHCYAVTGLGLVPPWCVNAGIISGQHTTLIADTGANAFSAATIHGYAVAACPSNKLIVINLEKHFDHIGGNSFFRDRDIDIYGHREINRTQEEFAAEIAEFNDAIPNRARRESNEANVFYSGTVLSLPNRAISEETTFDLGGSTVEVLFTPGHTPTNLSLYIPEDRVVYSADCFVNGYIPNLDAGGPTDWKIWLASIQRLASLEPSIIVPGHGHPATGDAIPRMIDRMVSILEAAIAAGRSPTASIELTSKR